MILDYTYNQKQRELSLSYVTQSGGKKILNFNVDKFKSYYKTPGGRFTNWDGDKCDEKWIKRPGMFEYKTFIEELPVDTKKLLMGKVSPKLFTWDIEVEIPEDNSEFPEPSEAKFPITNISIASSDLNVIVLGTRNMDEQGELNLQHRYNMYLDSCEFYKRMKLDHPYIKFIKFDNEEEMIRYFLKNIVSKVPVIAGWNSLLFDWYYVQTRIKNYFPGISMNLASPNGMMSYKNYTDLRGNKVRLLLPIHTLVLDMMDVIGTFDMAVMPIKESLSLDYIASESIGMHKIKYNGNLQQLYNQDYSTYVFYNAIDSVLVQLIDKKFKTLQNICTQALYCKEKIGSCFSKIAISESLVFNDFYEQGIKITNEFKETEERGELPGAYVKQPIPGFHKFICCNDFASLYPTGIITCNISYENYLGNDYTEEEMEKFRSNPKYFVSINGNVYKNDKDYSFKRIQKTLKENRNVGKYLAKQLDAVVMTDIDHILKNRKHFEELEKAAGHHKSYAENLVKAMEEIGYYVPTTLELLTHPDDWLLALRRDLANEIVFYTSYEQAMKLLGNSMYGGSSHVAFYWFNINLARDITGEGRNLIHLMEKHIPEFWRDNWTKLTDVHKMLGIQVDNAKAAEILKTHDSFVDMVYGDTDSLYIAYENILNTIVGIENWTIEQKRDMIVKLNTDFMDQHNCEYISAYYDKRHAKSAHKFELETLSLSGVWLNVKKRYAQILLWKDGKIFDMDSLPLKAKGLEIIKSSYPAQSRTALKHVVRKLLLETDMDNLWNILNIELQKEKVDFFNAPLEDICYNLGIGAGKYTQYILDDTKEELKVASKCPVGPKALGNYNRLRNIHKLPGDPLYGGKAKVYFYYPAGFNKRIKHIGDDALPFGFQASNYPQWADKYAPVSREVMFQKYLIDPFNRIVEALNIGEFFADGHREMSLF